MRKVQKEQVEKFVISLKNAHSEIIKFIENNEIESVLDVLEKCYQAAIKIGTFIENIEGKGFITVGVLEKYCEIIFNVHKLVATTRGWNMADIQSVLDKIYLSIEKSVSEDIKVRKEVIFLPYKVAMWDSLESVWKAANEDLECDTYVIPIPYFEKNQDGSLGKMVYEGNGYPEYVPVVDFRKYDIEKRRPDEIYIHNPYDNNNGVTSIHPDYYSERLYELTDKLVYIPYFVADRGVPKDLRVLPGVIYAHEVRVTNDKEKEDYIAGMEEWIDNKTLSGDYELYMPNWREKFVVVSSPKYDKVENTKRDKDKLPKEWADKIYRSDGTRRKVLFYNTTLARLLDKDNILEKIERTIELVTREEGIVMWWRPHPLYEVTIKNNKPELLEKYRKIVSDYKLKNVGIFDDSSDLHRAIVESDVYYGDGSSVVYLFERLNKPILLQNVDICN